MNIRKIVILMNRHTVEFENTISNSTKYSTKIINSIFVLSINNCLVSVSISLATQLVIDKEIIRNNEVLNDGQQWKFVMSKASC